MFSDSDPVYLKCDLEALASQVFFLFQRERVLNLVIVVHLHFRSPCRIETLLNDFTELKGRGLLSGRYLSLTGWLQASKKHPQCDA